MGSTRWTSKTGQLPDEHLRRLLERGFRSHCQEVGRHAHSVTVYVDKVRRTPRYEVIDTKAPGHPVDFDEMRSGCLRGRDIRGSWPDRVQAAVAIELYQKITASTIPTRTGSAADPLGSFYGQAPSSIIYLGFGVFRGRNVAAGGMFGGSSIARFNKDVVAHETAHQWWGSGSATPISATTGSSRPWPKCRPRFTSNRSSAGRNTTRRSRYGATT